MLNFKRLLLLCLLQTSYSFIHASGIAISDMIWYHEDRADRKSYCLFTLQWDNAWNNSKNHDAAWVFLKLVKPGSSPRHVFMMKDGIQVIADHTGKNGKYKTAISNDQSGFFVYPSEKYRGKIQLTIKVFIDVVKSGNLNAAVGTTLTGYGIEMVQVPAGGFYVGEQDTAASRIFHTFFLADKDGKHAGLFELKNEEEEIIIGKGSLYYQSTDTMYQGDMKGTVPKEFPKGVKSFYCMKYELSQGQYCAFLNSLNSQQTTARANFAGNLYYQQRGTVGYKDEIYVAEFPNRPCNFLSWDDAMAYADWACLRPLTELEFEKASKGPAKPVANVYPWGTNSKDKLQRMVNTNGDLIFTNGLDESQLNDSNLEQFGASFYWVMDLAGSLWERTITLGDEKGRSFTGINGDGQLTYYGFANVKDWPTGATETSGFGFRGGGFYTHDRSYAAFNPYSPVSYRMYASWSGGARTEAYGSRFARTE